MNFLQFYTFLMSQNNNNFLFLFLPSTYFSFYSADTECMRYEHTPRRTHIFQGRLPLKILQNPSGFLKMCVEMNTHQCVK